MINSASPDRTFWKILPSKLVDRSIWSRRADPRISRLWYYEIPLFTIDSRAAWAVQRKTQIGGMMNHILFLRCPYAGKKMQIISGLIGIKVSGIKDTVDKCKQLSWYANAHVAILSPAETKSTWMAAELDFQQDSWAFIPDPRFLADLTKYR